MTTVATPYSPALNADTPITASLQTGDLRLIDELSPQWTRLCEEANAPIFLTPEWIRCFMRAFEPDTPLVVISVWDGKRLLAILPLTHKRIWYRGIRLLELKGAANAHAVEFDLLHLPGSARDAAIAQVWRCLQAFPEWHVLQFPYTPADGASQQILQQAAENDYSILNDVCADNPVLEMHVVGDKDYDPYVNTDRRFRHELRRGTRKLEATLGAPPSLIHRTDVDDEQLRRFFALEAAGWKGSEGTAIQCSADTLSYYHQMACVAEDKRAFSFHSLEVNGRMIAACIGIEAGRRYYALKLAYEQEVRNCGPGQLLISRVLEDLAKRGFLQVFLGGKMDPFKREWTQTTQPQVNALIFNKTMRSRFVHRERTQIFPAIRQLKNRFKQRLGT